MSHAMISLTDFDEQIIIQYNISANNLVNVQRYLQAMQAHLSSGTWEEITLGGYYGTAARLHEVVELCFLLNRYPYLLTRPDAAIKAFACRIDNEVAHVRGLEAEYHYLHRILWHVLGQKINIGALLKANTRRPGDWDSLFETDLPFFDPTEDEIKEATRLLRLLRERGKERW